MKIAICDDVSIILDKIEDILESNKELNKLDMDILQFVSIESVIEYLREGNIIDLIFLDIEFPEKSGIYLANFIRNIKENYATEIIFISGSDKYFRELLDFQPTTFIKKPFIDSDIIEAFEIFLKRLDVSNLKFIFKSEGHSYLVPYNEILYFESEGKKNIIYYGNKSYSFYGKFSDLNEKIDRDNFIRIHRSYIVNFDKVTSITKNSLLLTNSIQLPIGRKYRELVEDTILNTRL